jgi:YfiH family protein
VNQPRDTMVLRSELLVARGVRHGFSTRNGGVSDGPFATLNVAVGPGDRPEAVAENLRRLAGALELDPSRLYQTSQVHGAAVRTVRPSDDRMAMIHEEADALVTREPGTAIGVRVADCVPVLLFDERTGFVAAAHAGWKGVVGGVLRETIAMLDSNDGAGEHTAIVAAIGPSIGPCCFEVGEDVARTIAASAPEDPAVIVRGGEKPRVDLRRAVRVQLRGLGLDDARIEDVPGCTRCEPERFFSYRRDGARSGRHLALIAPRAEKPA